MSDHETKLAAATKRVRQMDENDGYEARAIGLLITALDCGLRGTDDDPAYDALVMLRDIQSVIITRPILNVVSLKELLENLDKCGGVQLAEKARGAGNGMPSGEN